ncbi:hypothetical protein FUA23_18675 [Neolewinella aurantiaca]|uniref:Tetratricopeptide repeat protein n=1 Tax=Neolewinella aurantiaca TaxID=2602767 RepID=A0A5C7FCB9_9BACT|nr:hypothetical protein [Neolewinella aurantiaca]TXF87118.1 hypothetical protein FUA23_18675 [Neolewinella aurantiaca]
MKFSHFFLSFMLLGLLSGQLSANDTTPPDEVLKNVEQRINTAMSYAFMKRSISFLTDLRAEIAAVEAPDQRRLAAYWTAYTDFQITIYQLKSRKAEEAVATLNNAVAAVEAMDSKNAEELTLLAYLQDFAVQFVAPEEREALSKAASKNVMDALKLDGSNLRANYVYGRQMFYDGATDEVETILKKAISLPANPGNDDTQPGWGKADTYELLVQYYLKQGRNADAKTTLDAGLKAYPDNYQLSVLVPEVEKSGKK